MKFIAKAIDKNKKQVKIEIDAEDRKSAIFELRNRGFLLLELTADGDRFSISISKSTKHLIGVTVIVIGLAGSLGYFYLSKYFFSEVVTSVALQEKNGLFYLPDEEQPFTGKQQEFHTNGKLKVERNFKNGKRNGLLFKWYESGKLELAINYKDGGDDGLVTTWYEIGKKQGELNFKNGQLDGLSKVWYESGQKKGETNFKNGQLDGLSKGWYESGQKQTEINYKDGKKNGLSSGWYENGQLQATVNFLDDKSGQLMAMWDENGNLQPEENFKYGKPISVTKTTESYTSVPNLKPDIQETHNSYGEVNHSLVSTLKSSGQSEGERQLNSTERHLLDIANSFDYEPNDPCYSGNFSYLPPIEAMNAQSDCIEQSLAR